MAIPCSNLKIQYLHISRICQLIYTAEHTPHTHICLVFVLVYLWNVQIVQLKENEKIKRIPNKIYIVLINWMDSFHMADGNSVMCISCMNPVWLLWFAGRVRKVLWANTGNIEIKSRKNTDTHTHDKEQRSGARGENLFFCGTTTSTSCLHVVSQTKHSNCPKFQESSVLFPQQISSSSIVFISLVQRRIEVVLCFKLF